MYAGIGPWRVKFRVNAETQSRCMACPGYVRGVLKVNGAHAGSTKLLDDGADY